MTFVIVRFDEETGNPAVLDAAYSDIDEARQVVRDWIKHKQLEMRAGYDPLGDFWHVQWPSGAVTRFYVDEDRFVPAVGPKSP